MISLCTGNLYLLKEHTCSQIVTHKHSKLPMYIQVVFSGEPAVDEGGPRREFFHLGLSDSVGDPSLFTGPRDCRAVLYNSATCLLKHYQYVWNLISMSLTQGEPIPSPAFSGSVFRESHLNVSHLRWARSSMLSAIDVQLPVLWLGLQNRDQ